MTFRLLRFSALAASGIFLAACASSPQVDPAISAALSSHGVNQGTYDKVVNGQVLDYDDIKTLVQQDVSSNVIVAYLTSTRKVYDFTFAQLQGLKSAGASPQVLNYLTETQGFYGVNTPKQTARVKNEQKRAYFNSPGYQNQQPFAYNQPAIDGWYDSGYEESLYSPFSFN
jgi:hypothetical protein